MTIYVIRQVLVLPEIILNMEHDIRRSEETQDIRKNVQRKAADRREFLKKSSKAGHALCRKNGIISLRPGAGTQKERTI